MSMRVKIIIAVSLVASYFFIGGATMARYDRLHDPINCEQLIANDGYRSWDFRKCLKRNDNRAFEVMAGLGWPVYLLISFGIEMGENHE